MFFGKCIGEKRGQREIQGAQNRGNPNENELAAIENASKCIKNALGIHPRCIENPCHGKECHPKQFNFLPSFIENQQHSISRTVMPQMSMPMTTINPCRNLKLKKQTTNYIHTKVAFLSLCINSLKLKKLNQN